MEKSQIFVFSICKSEKFKVAATVLRRLDLYNYGGDFTLESSPAF